MRFHRVLYGWELSLPNNEGFFFDDFEEAITSETTVDDVSEMASTGIDIMCQDLRLELEFEEYERIHSLMVNAICDHYHIR